MSFRSVKQQHQMNIQIYFVLLANNQKHLVMLRNRVSEKLMLTIGV